MSIGPAQGIALPLETAVIRLARDWLFEESQLTEFRKYDERTQTETSEQLVAEQIRLVTKHPLFSLLGLIHHWTGMDGQVLKEAAKRLAQNEDRPPHERLRLAENSPYGDLSWVVDKFKECDTIERTAHILSEFEKKHSEIPPISPAATSPPSVQQTSPTTTAITTPAFPPIEVESGQEAGLALPAYMDADRLTASSTSESDGLFSATDLARQLGCPDETKLINDVLARLRIRDFRCFVEVQNRIPTQPQFLYYRSRVWDDLVQWREKRATKL